MKTQITSPRPGWTLAVLLVVCVLAIGVTAWLYSQKQEKEILREAHETLGAIADLKVGQIANWYAERKGDAEVILKNPMVMTQAHQFLATPANVQVRADLTDWMEAIRRAYDYSRVALYDAQGVLRLCLPTNPPSQDGHFTEESQAALRAKTVVVTDLHRGQSNQPVHLSVWVPVRIKPDADQLAEGVFLLQIDPERFLYPHIQTWPAPSRTAETLLVRREGDEVVYLNELRHRKDTALSLRFPISRRELPAVKAVLGMEGVFAGRDYRGVPVQGTVRAVPGTPWFIVAKMDEEEILGPFREQAWTTSIIASVLALAASLGVAFFWNQQNLRFARVQLAEQRQRQTLAERIAYLSKHANDIIFLTDQDWKIIEANDRALDTYGYSLDELRRLTLRDLREHDTRGDFDRQVSQLDVRNGLILETLHQRKDGSTFPVESSIRAAELEGQKFHQSIIRDITERKRAAEALCASEVRYRRLFETAKDGILILDAETGMVVDVNPFLVERLGFSHEQFLGKEVWELGFFKDIIANHANFEELQQEEYIRYEDKPLKTAGGQQIDVEFVSNVYQVNHHKVIQCNIRDITERKRAEQALRASEERFRIAAETANDVVYEWDLKQSVQWPGKIDEMLGYEPGEFPRTLDGWATSVHPEDMERTMAAVHAHLEGRAPYMAEYRVRRKDGVYAWWSARGAAARTSDGKPVRWIGSITDITERKRAEEALRQSERLYRGIGESIDYGVWVCAPDGRNIYASESFLKLVGITQEQCSNFGWANVLHPEDAERTIAAWKECVRTGGTWDIEHRFRGVDGKWHAVLARGVPVRDEQGQITCWAGINLDITERKQAAEALRASEVRYRRLFEAARDGVLILDAETGMVVDVNPFLIGLLGYSRESFLGKEVWELGFFKDIFANQDHFAELQQKEYIRYEDRPLETADGRRIDVEFVSNVYLVNHEKVIQCNIRDITERRRAGKALQALSSRQEAILATVPGIIMEVDTHKVYAWANQAGLAFFGDDVIGKEAACYFEGEQATYQSVQPLFDGHQDLIYVESWQRRKDGEKRLLAWWCRVLKDENGNVTGALSSAHDITEQRRATEALRESEEKFKCVFENSNAGMSITRPSGELQVNQAFCDLLGYSPAELRHQQWQALTHPEDLEPTQWMVDGLLAGKQDSARLTKRYLHKNGSVVWADVSTSLRRDEAGQPLYFIAIVTDFTARQRAEEEVRRLNQTLEQRVRDRTAQLEAANQELEAFSYSVSHDLRAPLRAIDGFTNILVEDYAQGLDEEGQRTLGIIRGEAKRMGELIDDLLAFSRMSREAIQSVEVDMGAVAQAMFDECAAQAPGRKLEFKLQPLPSAHGDQAMLRQVLANLLANAIKFTRYKAPAEIEIGGRVEGGEHVYYVKDNGVGFDIRYAHKLFGVFQRLHTEAEFEGTGVGLALVQRVIHRHGGRVWAEGKVNEGATFFFTLPGTNEEGRMKNEE